MAVGKTEDPFGNDPTNLDRKPRQRSALLAAASSPSLRHLLEAFAAVNFAEWGIVTALAVHLYRTSGFLAVGLVGFRFVPAAVGSLLVGPLVHRHRGSRVMTVVAGVRSLTLFGLAVALAAGSPVTILLVLVGFDALVSTPYRPSQVSLIASLARTPGEVTGATAATSVVKSLSQAAGAATGAILIAHLAVDRIALGSAGMMALAALLTLTLRRGSLFHRSRVREVSLRMQLSGAVATLSDRQVSPVILASGLRCFVRGQWTALLVVTALKLFNLGPSGVSKFTAAAGLGSIVAVALTSQLIGKVRLGTATAVAFIACGAFISLVGLTNSADIAYGFVVCWGIAMAVADSTSFSVLYRMSDPVIRAKTVGVLESVKFALEGIGAIVAPLLVYLLGIRGALIAVGFPLLLLIAISWRRIHAADAVGVDRSKIVNLLYQVPALHVPDMSLMEDVASRVTPMQYRAGGEIICEGEEGDRFYVIASGTVQVSMSGYPIGDLGPGGSFGERALLRNARRSATVTAVTDTSLLTLSRSDFLSATQGGPQRGERVGRSAEGNAPKSVQWTPKLVAEILADQILFGRLTTRSILDLAHAADVSHWAPGSDIIVQGDPGEAFYVILEGRTRVAIDGSVVNELHPGDAFGEISLLHDVPRRATVTAVTSVTVCTLTRQQFALGAQHLQTSGGVAGLVT